MIELLRQLVAIDSTSSLSNLPMIEALERALPGFAFERQAWGDKANLIARRGGGGNFALVGHTDCVPYDKAWRQALSGEVSEGKLYGRGAADTKAFIAASVTAALKTTQPVTLIFTADEEVGCLGARKLSVEVKNAIVGEPTRMIPVLGHKGYCLAEIEITGIEGHSAYPDTGASAILAAGRMLREIEAASEELRADRDARFAPPYTTYNVGLINGGKAKNIIAGRCSLTVEWRPLPSQDVQYGAELLKKAAAKIATDGIDIEVKVLRLDKGIAVPEELPIVRFLQSKTGNAPETIPFGTELPYLAALGAQACVFGPGDIRVAHRTGEFVPLTELEAATGILAEAIQRFA